MLTLIFLIVFPFAFWNAWKTIERAKASVNWPSTTGTITASGTKKAMFRSQPRIAYSYEVNGTAFSSERISFAPGVPPKETEAIVARYPVGKTVAVQYSPEKPSEAVLESGATKNVRAQFRFLVTCFIIIIVVNVGLYFLRSLEAQ
jgi:hypothetical protein